MERQRIALSRLDGGLQEQASRVYEKIGMDLTTAVQCFLMETVHGSRDGRFLLLSTISEWNVWNRKSINP